MSQEYFIPLNIIDSTLILAVNNPENDIKKLQS